MHWSIVRDSSEFNIITSTFSLSLLKKTEKAIFFLTDPPYKYPPPLKKIEARFGLQQAGVENQKKPQVNILDCWLNTS